MKLIHHKSCNVKNYSVNLSAKLFNQCLTLQFSVLSGNGTWNTVPSDQFDPARPARNWTLWNYDVVEVFLQKRTANHNSYIEFQATPTGEELVLEIYRPRVQYACPLVAHNVFSHVWSANSWIASFNLQLEQDASQYWLGAFACLGKEQREYLSLNPNPEVTPDYHRPELFLPLSQIL